MVVGRVDETATPGRGGEERRRCRSGRGEGERWREGEERLADIQAERKGECTSYTARGKSLVLPLPSPIPLWSKVVIMRAITTATRTRKPSQCWHQIASAALPSAPYSSVSIFRACCRIVRQVVRTFVARKNEKGRASKRLLLEANLYLVPWFRARMCTTPLLNMVG